MHIKNDSVYKIKESDFLWKFYCKYFYLIDSSPLPIDPPKTICRYFKLAVCGFYLWLKKKVSWWKLWGTEIAVCMLIIYLVNMLPVSKLWPRPLAEIGIPLLVLCLMLNIILPLFVTIMKISDWEAVSVQRETILKVLYPFSLVLLVFFGRNQLGLVLEKYGKDILWDLVYGLAGLVLFLISYLIIYYICSIDKDGKSVRFLMQIKLCVSSLKNKVCWRVQSPADSN